MQDTEPQVKVVGDGEPSVAVVGSIHGDEPSGAKAIERILSSPPDHQKAVKYVIANPPALERGVRYIDADMNRVFPGDKDSDDRERRLAARVCEETSGYTTLALHSTRSQPEPFALMSQCDRELLTLASRLPVAHVVDESEISEGSFTNCGSVVSVECGCQGTAPATDTAERVVCAFLDAVGAADTVYEPGSDPDYFAVRDQVPKDPDATHELLVDNFCRVEEGEAYALSDGADIVADQPFYPILMSPDGYEEVLGYGGEKVAADLDGALEYFGC
jgi:hypothetical protein